MKFLPTNIPEVLLIEPSVFQDERGFFLETYHAHKYQEGGIALPFVQDNYSSSVKNTLRGLHLQTTRSQGKLIRVVRGEIFDVAVDLRRGSPTFLQWVGIFLSPEGFRQLYIPPGFAHGFCVRTDVAEVEYKCTDVYVPGDEVTIRWDEKSLGIQWPVEVPILSPKDARGKSLNDVMPQLPQFVA